MVEKASRRLSSSWDRAMQELNRMVMDAMTMTRVPRLNAPSRSTPKIPVRTLTMENTPTLTTATACKRALTGVGATMLLAARNETA